MSIESGIGFQMSITSRAGIETLIIELASSLTTIPSSVWCTRGCLDAGGHELVDAPRARPTSALTTSGPSGIAAHRLGSEPERRHVARRICSTPGRRAQAFVAERDDVRADPHRRRAIDRRHRGGRRRSSAACR